MPIVYINMLFTLPASKGTDSAFSVIASFASEVAASAIFIFEAGVVDG